jgi:prepilin peptidase CpaA
MVVLQSFLLAVLALLLLGAAVMDLRARIIPDRLNIAVAVLAAGWWIANGLGLGAIGLQLLAALLVFGLFAGLFALGMIGGGDVKLLTALALWLPPMLLIKMLVLMVLAGGLLSIAMIAWKFARKSKAAGEVPYGVAIAAATLIVLTHDLLTIPTA